jgi:hypothetical protein
MEDQKEIVRLNIEYYKKLYEKDPDEVRRQMLMRHLDEKQARLTSHNSTPNRADSSTTSNG